MLLGNHDVSDFDDSIGQFLFYTFIVLVHVVLFNLVLARLSSSHEDMKRKAWGERALLKGQILREYLSYPIRNSYCMLPPPFNVISTVASFIFSNQMVENLSDATLR